MGNLKGFSVVVYRQEIITPDLSPSVTKGGPKNEAPFSELKETFQTRLERREYPPLSSVRGGNNYSDLKSLAEQYRTGFETVLILGTGGSSLGAQTLCALKNPLPSIVLKKPNLVFLDNIDPHTFQEVFTGLDWSKTGVIAVSKSGHTPETLCQLLVIIERFKSVVTEEALSHHMALITEDKESPFMEIGGQYALKQVDHPKTIGGRYSIFSSVGALPALIAGVDMAQVLEGARWTLDHPDMALRGALTIWELYKQQSISNTILMPYRDQLFLFAGWFRQLWAESLGKNGKGFTPIRALGTVDQHSQTQLYLDGPRDKFFTFVLTNCQGTGEGINTSLPDLAYLNGKTMGDLLDAEQRATVMTFHERKLPLRVLHIEALSEKSIGALLMHFMIETLGLAHLMGVNPFDQPAVEAGKVLTKRYLNQIPQTAEKRKNASC